MRGPTREWVSFEDPREEGRTWLIDVTFLTSHWQCIYGRGCQGVNEKPTPELMQGCCSLGAYLSDKKDRDAVVKAARKLSADDWQFRGTGRKKGAVVKTGKKDWRTRVVDDACIFLNRPGFAGGAGCALHHYAARTGVHFREVKPEVCWQLPLRREDEEQDDGSVISRLTEFARSGWGDGGVEFAWWCTEAPEAFSAAEPVYRTLAAELEGTLGAKLYRRVVEYLDTRRADTGVPPVRHPAEVPVRLVEKPETSEGTGSTGVVGA